jgi:hypothetical protein
METEETHSALARAAFTALIFCAVLASAATAEETPRVPPEILSLKVGTAQVVVTGELSRAGFWFQRGWGEDHRVILPDSAARGIESIDLGLTDGVLSSVAVHIDHDTLRRRRWGALLP